MSPQFDEFDDLERENASAHTERQTAGSSGSNERPPVKTTVIYEQNPRGAMTLRDRDNNATYQVVEYASPELREEASHLDRGTPIEARLERAGCRGNVWRAEELAESSER